MPSSDRLDRPAEWPATERARYKVSLIFLIVLALLCLPVGYGFVSIGRPAAVKYVLLFAALFLLAIAFGFITRIRPQHREGDIALTSYDEQLATEIRYSGTQFAILVALVACVAAMWGLASWDFAFAGEAVPAAPLAATLTGLLAVFLLSFFVLLALGRLRRGRIILSQQGIHQEGRAFTSFLPWKAFAGAKAAYNGTPEVLVIAYTNAPWEKRQLSNLWKLDKLPPVPMIEIDTFHLAVDANLVYYLVRFSTENPPLAPSSAPKLRSSVPAQERSSNPATPVNDLPCTSQMTYAESSGTGQAQPVEGRWSSVSCSRSSES